MRSQIAHATPLHGALQNWCLHTTSTRRRKTLTVTAPNCMRHSPIIMQGSSSVREMKAF